MASAGKSGRFSSFSDPALSDGRIVIDLIDACRPGVIKYDLVKDAFTDEVRNTFIVLFCSSVALFDTEFHISLLSIN